MGDGTKENPFTREDVRKRIRQNGDTAKGLDLSGKEFEKEIDLCDLNLKGIILNNAGLFRAKFNGSNLTEAKLRGTNLLQAKFNPMGDYELNKFANLRDADLSGADLSEAEFIGAFLNYAKFKDATLMNANFISVGERIPDLLYTDFRGANLTFSDFTGRTFSFTKLEGAHINWAKILEASLGDADWGNYIIDEEKKDNFYSAAHRYRHLKNWYNSHGYSDTAAKFYYREKEANRKRLKLLSRDWHHRIASELIRALFGYGERWWNVVFFIETLILLFAFTYSLIIAEQEIWKIIFCGWIPGLAVWFFYLRCVTDLNWTWWQKTPLWLVSMVALFAAFYFLTRLLTSEYLFWRYLYFSTVSFTALGYGEWAKLSDGLASDFIKGIGAFESLVGISTLALLLVTFFRKWTR